MANSKFEYVRLFEQDDSLLPNTWIVVRIDGRGFHKFSKKYAFEKPNDRRAIDLMNEAARGVLEELHDLVLAYGVSDEFSFIFHPSTNLFERRSSKLVTTIVSTFTAYYVYLWPKYFAGVELTAPLPSFDGRAVCYPSLGNLRDYCSWRQADCHINNLFNTTFWNLVLKGGMSTTEAEKELAGTVSAQKNEILFSRFGINYNKEPEVYKKGSVLFREYELAPKKNALKPAEETDPTTAIPESLSKTATEKEAKRKAKASVVVEHIDIIKDDFWVRRPWILTGKAGKLPT